ncbi:Hypothetical predicted protein [Cloeon dipterum]|uniref:C2H2-type domain-containing protein n=1 Tax=Cloeon dipterum TaxID=197152 RepID=A0A8S1C7J3_9INSE|nr:Hypothetical predicted protein [Cloeon dipterum]
MAARFTCLSCRVIFQDPELQRVHYKTEWHRYNLKRKIAELPAVTSEEFERRTLQHKETEEVQEAFYCKPCCKTFGSQKSFDNHLPSKRHKEAVNKCDFVQVKEVSHAKQVVQEEEASDVEEVDSDEWDEEIEIDAKDCLFCEHHSASTFKNLKHMSEAHSFFIPDLEFVSDLRGLLSYLGSKVREGFMCLWCSGNNKAFWSAEATRQHMTDKGHCKVKYEGETLMEFADFYDYRSSYPDNNEEDMEVDVPVLEDNDFQLTLPSGAIIGHRSLFTYYRQNLNPNGALLPVKPKHFARYKAIGYTESTKEAILKKSRDIQYMRRVQSKMSMKVGVKANKLQPHFRAQVNF